MRFIRLNNENVVMSIRIGKEIVEGEIQSDIGESGQIMQPDGTFVNPPEPETQITILDKINYLYYKSKGVIIG